ncbi:hypothetical protein RJ639_046416 [Escallonia herrerae]|uniref:Uncharacterized protein n=1 Tax=Escallonia herrerae TaxID=1293975 RepID=A0AA88W8D2_9ASTE|nr:hypothetical protein RJ639_046416 [Escallonia herrerae]
MSLEAPQFQEAPRCDVCKCSFNTFRRRVFSIAMKLLLLTIADVVAELCVLNIHQIKWKDDTPASLDEANFVTSSVARLDITTVADIETRPTAEQFPVIGILECQCGMPLCICEAPAPTPSPSGDAVTMQGKVASTSKVHSNAKPKKADSLPKSKGSTSNSKRCMISNLGQVTNNTLEKPVLNYEVNGEGLREAIKNGDITAASKLLSQGVDANYCDKQGLSLLHLAAVFNQTDIAFALMEHGASLDCKNLQGETPLDCAPVTLQYKMKKKMEEGP